MAAAIDDPEHALTVVVDILGRIEARRRTDAVGRSHGTVAGHRRDIVFARHIGERRALDLRITHTQQEGIAAVGILGHTDGELRGGRLQDLHRNAVYRQVVVRRRRREALARENDRFAGTTARRSDPRDREHRYVEILEAESRYGLAPCGENNRRRTLGMFRSRDVQNTARGKGHLGGLAADGHRVLRGCLAESPAVDHQPVAGIARRGNHVEQQRRRIGLLDIGEGDPVGRPTAHTHRNRSLAERIRGQNDRQTLRPGMKDLGRLTADRHLGRFGFGGEIHPRNDGDTPLRT